MLTRYKAITDEDMRKYWFPKHTGLYLARKNALYEKLIWANPDTTTYLIVYIRDGQYLTVTGDVGEAIYRWSGKGLTLKQMTGCDIVYFSSKCVASETGRGYPEWSGDRLLDRIDMWFEDLKRDAINTAEVQEVKRMQENWAEQSSFADVHNEQEWTAWLSNYGNDVFGPKWQYIPDGKIINARCHAHLFGIKMAFESMPLTTTAGG